MYQKCALCLKSHKNYPELSMHQFPKNPVTRKIWLDACELTEEDIINPNRYLCSSHFELECYKMRGRKNYLKIGSMPTKLLEKPTTGVQTTRPNEQQNDERDIQSGHHDETSSVPERNVNIFQVTRDQDCRVYVLVQPINRRAPVKKQEVENTTEETPRTIYSELIADEKKQAMMKAKKENLNK